MIENDDDNDCEEDDEEDDEGDVLVLVLVLDSPLNESVMLVSDIVVVAGDSFVDVVDVDVVVDVDEHVRGMHVQSTGAVEQSCDHRTRNVNPMALSILISTCSNS